MSERTDRDGTYQVTHRLFCAGMTVRNDRVAEAAPRLGWLCGKRFGAAYLNLVSHGATCERVADA